jgi:hypothetical protein
MPRGDGTGPWGQGAMTGKGAGFCGTGRGRGVGGRGDGRGQRNMCRATGTPGWERSGSAPGQGGVGPSYGTDVGKAKEVESLRQQAEYFKASLEDIEKRLQAMESRDE